jgi:recombination protein RecR
MENADVIPLELQKLQEELERLPGIGPKSSIRMCLYFLSLNNSKIHSLAKIFEDIANNIVKCKVCGNYANSDICKICSDGGRDASCIMIVEDFLDLMSFQSLREFNGYYHVLGGLISPVNGVTLEDINIATLRKRLQSLEDIKDIEIIFGLSPSLEGEATAQYIQEYLSDVKGKEIKYTFLAQGLPSGADLEYLDKRTLSSALKARKAKM